MSPADHVSASLDEAWAELRKLSDAATPGPWGTGFWHGQCHQHEDGRHPGPPKCKYDYTLATDPEYDEGGHHIVALSDPVSVAGNYDYEEGGIVTQADRDFIVAAVNYVRSALREVTT